MQPKVTLLVAMRNEAGFIEKCLTSILAQDYPSELLEIWVMDGLSSDHSWQIVEQLFQGRPHCHLISNRKVTQAAGWNLGITQASKSRLDFGMALAVIGQVSGHRTIKDRLDLGAVDVVHHVRRAWCQFAHAATMLVQGVVDDMNKSSLRNGCVNKHLAQRPFIGRWEPVKFSFGDTNEKGQQITISQVMLRQHALRIARSSVVEVLLSDDAVVVVRTRGDRLAAGHVREASFVHPWLTTIVWRPDGARFSRSLAIVPDMLDVDDFRRLRVLLRYGRREVTADAPASHA